MYIVAERGSFDLEEIWALTCEIGAVDDSGPFT
jgi:hypothetical protein